ncbi:MAG TPA: hypothetical protein VFM63_14240 [Pyrinomonadaceae bacterium]|nr:hypothetical protein [Pyrinomonadaceae bacterium]
MRFIVTVALLLTLAFAVAAQEPPPAAKDDNANTWKEFTSKEGQFSVLLPGKPAQQDRTLQTGLGPIATHDFTVQSDISLFYLSYAEFPKLGPLTQQDHKEMLDSSRDRALSQGAKLISEVDVSVDGSPGREVIAEKDGMILRARFFYANDKLYNVILGVTAKTAFNNSKPSANPADRTELFEAISAKFFNSFKFTK